MTAGSPTGREEVILDHNTLPFEWVNVSVCKVTAHPEYSEYPEYPAILFSVQKPRALARARAALPAEPLKRAGGAGAGTCGR